MPEIANFLESFNGSISIVVHERPDPDCIGSALALYNFLKLKGKKVHVVSKDEPPSSISFLKGFEDIERKLIPSELYILVDASEFERTGYETPSGNIVKIDHHVSSLRYSQYDVLDENAPATASLVLNVLRSWDEELIDKHIAEALYVGILTDTGGFSYSNLKWAFSDALYLINKGIDAEGLSHLIFRNSPIERFKLISLALSTLSYDSGIAWIVVRSSFYEITGAKREYNYGIVDYALSVKGASVGVKFEEYEDVWRVSLRSKGNIDVSVFASRYGGGGHRNASAFAIEGDEEEVVRKVISELKEYISAYV